MTFGERLKSLRLERDMTQPDLASGAGIGLATLKDYAGGRRLPSVEIAQKLAAALGVTCRAFDGVTFEYATPPADGKPRRRGRPPKTEAASDLPAAAPKKRGRKK